MLEKQNKSSQTYISNLSLQDEINKLQSSLENYHPRVTNDPLGWGLESLMDQYIDGNPRKEQLRKLSNNALDIRHLGLPFRLYGALIGALVVPSNVAQEDKAQQVLQACVTYQLDIMKKKPTSEEHGAINRVMLATALLAPGVLKRRDSGPLI